MTHSCNTSRLWTLEHRRWVMASLVILTVVILFLLMLQILGYNGLSTLDVVMLVCFTGTLPWIVVNFWNSLIGWIILYRCQNPSATVTPIAHPLDRNQRLTSRTALIMPVCDEQPWRLYHNMAAMLKSLDETPDAGCFEVFLLSDSQDPAIIAQEEHYFACLKQTSSRPESIHYRRRSEPVGYKPGNIWDFVDRWGTQFDYFVVLDVDSIMAGETLIRLVQIMDSHRQIGILQTLPIGLPSKSLFTRIFQFGMRQGMKMYTIGSTWWQGDEGLYWGHNAIIRMTPFRMNCRLPVLSGSPPWGGHIISHDQIEAVLMRKAGYEVRVLPEECDSYEESPPTLPDFIRRELRWAQGNLQYLRVIRMPGLRLIGRIKLLLAMWMYLTPLFWFCFLWLGFTSMIVTHLMSSLLMTSLEPVLLVDPAQFFDQIHHQILPFIILIMIFAPKLMGMADILLHAEKRQAYGGLLKVLTGTIIEVMTSVVLTPVIGLSISIHIISMFFGCTIRWQPQYRDGGVISIQNAFRSLWIPSVIGLVTALCLVMISPSFFLWTIPLLGGLVFSVPLAWLTSLSTITGTFCMIPEERNPPQIIKMARSVVPEARMISTSLTISLPTTSH